MTYVTKISSESPTLTYKWRPKEVTLYLEESHDIIGGASYNLWSRPDIQGCYRNCFSIKKLHFEQNESYRPRFDRR